MSDHPTRQDGVPGTPNGHRLPGSRAEEHGIPADLPRITTRGAAVIAVTVVALFAALFAVGWAPQSRRLSEARSEAREAAQARPMVDVVIPRRASGTVEFSLPADVRPNQSTAVYARTSGYLKPLPPGIDIGSHVRAGQAIAEIAAPEVDADLEQARATLEQAKVAVAHATDDYNFNKATLERYQGFAATGGLTIQQLDERRQQYSAAASALRVAEANAAAAAASAKRLEELQGFERITAPFDGVITTRNYDAGALISSSDTGPGKELFRIDQNDPLRVYLNVPQNYATDISAGIDADLTLRNFPGERFKGAVARTSESIDPTTRTLRVEVQVPNPGARLLPGMYGEVRFALPREHPPLLLPTSTLVFGVQGMSVALVDQDHRIRFRPVVIGRDLGAEAEISDGLTGDEHVVNSPSQDLADGVDVDVRAPKAPAAEAKEPRR